MALMKISGGPLDGQERDIENPDALAAEYPGYSAVEQVMDPERGQLLKAEWHGDEAAEASYSDSPQERERYGNQTGVRASSDEDPNAGEPVDRTKGETTGAQKRDAKNDVSDAKRK